MSIVKNSAHLDSTDTNVTLTVLQEQQGNQHSSMLAYIYVNGDGGREGKQVIVYLKSTCGGNEVNVY